MPKTAIRNRLTDARIKAAKPAGKRLTLCDGGFLYVDVEPTGKKVFRLRWNHKANQFTLGEYRPGVFGLSDARIRRDEVEKIIREGGDPKAFFEAKEKELEVARLANSITFDQVYEEWIDWKVRTVRREDTVKNIRGRVRKHMLPFLAGRPFALVRQEDFIPIISGMDKAGLPVEARKVIGTIKGIWDFGYIRKYTRERGITIGLETYLSRRPKVKHHAAITDAVEFGECLRRIDSYRDRAKLPAVFFAVKLLPLIFLRRDLLASLRWDNVDFKAKLIRKSGDEMKNDMPFEVPLSRQALEVLEEAHRVAFPSPWVFPSYSKDKHIEASALRRVLRFVGIPATAMTAHGFRTTAVTLIAQEFGTMYAPEIREAALSHKPKVAYGDTYMRTRFVHQRAAMMQTWADYCDELKAGVHGLPDADLWAEEHRAV